MGLHSCGGLLPLCAAHPEEAVLLHRNLRLILASVVASRVRAAVGLEGGGHQLAHAPDHPCLNIRVRRRELGVLRPVEAQVEQVD